MFQTRPAQAVSCGLPAADSRGGLAARGELDHSLSVPGNLVDHVLLPAAHEVIVPLVSGERAEHPIDALGIIETGAVASLIRAADAAAKAAPVRLLRIHLARRIGGKGYVVFTGDLADVEASVSAGAARAREERRLEAEVVIPVREKFLDAAGSVHGSVFHRAMNDAALFAVNSIVPKELILSTNFHIQLTGAIGEGELVARGRVIGMSEDHCLAEAVVLDSDGGELGRGKFVNLLQNTFDVVGFCIVGGIQLLPIFHQHGSCPIRQEQCFVRIQYGGIGFIHTLQDGFPFRAQHKKSSISPIHMKPELVGSHDITDV